jgi:hypothetical protein
VQNFLSRDLVWRTLIDLERSNKEVRSFFEANGLYGAEDRLPGIFRQCEAVWNAVPQTVQKGWSDNACFYQKLLEKFDYSSPSPTLKDVPVAIVSELLEALAPSEAHSLGRW